MQTLTYQEVIEWLRSHRVAQDSVLLRELASIFHVSPGFTSEGTVKTICYIIEIDHPDLEAASLVTEGDLQRFLEPSNV